MASSRCEVDVQSLEATGPERAGFRVNVETPLGVQAFGVLVAPSHDVWRARILTYPNVLWLGPDGKHTLKFMGASAQIAEQQAIDFIREHCRKKKYAMRDELVLAAPTVFAPERAANCDIKPASERKIRFLPVLFGLQHPAERGGTGNLSESGMFIMTDEPAKQGEELKLRLQLDTQELDLYGVVRWSRAAHRIGRAPGMGVKLLNPPTDYINYVRTLHA